jgi:hypothetical protein
MRVGEEGERERVCVCVCVCVCVWACEKSERRERAKHALVLQHTWTSNVKYFFMFLMIITRNGSLIPSVFFGSLGHVMYVVLRCVNVCVCVRE